MWSKIEIFNDIVQIMKNDYAGFSDKKHVNHPENYLIIEEMTDKAFVETVQSYLLDFKDGHLYFNFSETQSTNRGFKVRRFENALFVTEVTSEIRLKEGDTIIEIDGMKIDSYEKIHSKILEDDFPERQYWNAGLRYAENIVVSRNDERFILQLKDFEWEPYAPTYAFKQLDEKTVYLQIKDFANAVPIEDLLNKHEAELNHSQNLIIDVRVNHGGNDLFYFPILNYVFDQEHSFQDLFKEDEVMYTNYSERNCDLWIQEMQEYLEQNLDHVTEVLIKADIEMIEKNYATGMTIVPEDTEYTIHGQKQPNKVYVLTDTTCGSSGETFVINVKKSPKVTVVGRPTMGIMDYFNVVNVKYGKYEFDYSISKMDEKYHYNATGVEPDIYIPWSPQHIKEDLDLKYVLDIIQNHP
jgi:C-terminal processing protease CtpA/Prc